MGAYSGRSLGPLALLLGRTDGMTAGAVAWVAGRFSGGIFLEKRLLKLAKINKTEAINSTAGDTKIYPASHCCLENYLVLGRGISRYI